MFSRNFLIKYEQFVRPKFGNYLKNLGKSIIKFGNNIEGFLRFKDIGKL